MSSFCACGQCYFGGCEESLSFVESGTSKMQMFIIIFNPELLCEWCEFCRDSQLDAHVISPRVLQEKLETSVDKDIRMPCLSTLSVDSEWCCERVIDRQVTNHESSHF